VIDDKEPIKLGFHRFIVSRGNNVITAESCRKVLSRIDEMEFYLILEDIFLHDGILQGGNAEIPKDPRDRYGGISTRETIEASFHIPLKSPF